MGNVLVYFRPPTLAEIFPEIADIDEELEIEEIADTIMNSEKFRSYQDKFLGLSCPRDIYIDSNELFIESSDKYYSIQAFVFDWKDPKEIITMYDLLDSIYTRYNK